MSKALQKATAHFKEQVSGELKSIEIPQWDLTIYFRPAANFQQQMKVIEYTTKGDNTSAILETIIQRCLNADGSKMFSHADWDVLMREVDPNVLVQIVTIMNTKAKAAEDELGN